MNKDFEFKQLLRAYRNGIISEATFESELACMEGEAHANGNGNRVDGFKAFGRTYRSERDAIISFLDKVRDAESRAGEYLSKWVAVCKTECVRGGIKMVAEREAYHGRVFERRLLELGGQKRAAMSDEARKYAEYISNPNISDGEKLLRATASTGDPKEAIRPICEFADLIKEDQETKEMLNLFAQDELSSATWLRAACALINAPANKSEMRQSDQPSM
jgi:hypothetical protein